MLDLYIDYYIFIGIYELCHTYGCYDSSDTQLCVTLDGEEVYHADFKKGVLDWESKIPVVLHVPHAYNYAVYYRATCRGDLLRWKPDKSAATKPRSK